MGTPPPATKGLDRWDIHGWAETCKLARTLIMGKMLRKIGFNICYLQLDALAGISPGLKEVVK
jgi:hypothetical protein